MTTTMTTTITTKFTTQSSLSFPSTSPSSRLHLKVGTGVEKSGNARHPPIHRSNVEWRQPLQCGQRGENTHRHAHTHTCTQTRTHAHTCTQTCTCKDTNTRCTRESVRPCCVCVHVLTCRRVSLHALAIQRAKPSSAASAWPSSRPQFPPACSPQGCTQPNTQAPPPSQVHTITVPPHHTPQHCTIKGTRTCASGALMAALCGPNKRMRKSRHDASSADAAWCRKAAARVCRGRSTVKRNNGMSQTLWG